MRRISCMLLLLALVCFAALPVAATGAEQVRAQAALTAAGECTVSLTVGLHLDSEIDALTFPLPTQAENIRLNGSYTTASRANGALQVALPLRTAGDYTVTLDYRLRGVLSRDGDAYLLTLPLLSRFSYPITAFELTLTLPGNVENRPEFISGYYQSDTDRLIGYSVSGNVLTCTALETLKDHETLTLTLKVDPSMFPDALTETPRFGAWDGAALCLAVLAAVYYLLTLLPRLPRRARCYCAPDGISAGDVGTCLTAEGTDLTMLVMSWAQAGYLLIEMTLSGKVLLHKQMEMGNERSRFEADCFRSLFGRRTTVDGRGYHYAQLCRRLHRTSPLLRQLFLPSSGNPRLFHLLCGASAACSGVALALHMTDHAVGRVFLGLMLAVGCGAAAFAIRRGMRRLPLRDRAAFPLGLLCAAAWVALGALAPNAVVLPAVIFQLVAGLAAAFGGRRSEPGKRSLAQLLGLRQYMLHAESFELQRLLQANPNYFYELAPYALAMGVDRQFARRFGKTALPDCSFLITPLHKDMTPVKWMERLRQAADALDARQKRLLYDRLLSRR